jgi:hypothetical protein
LEQSFLKVFSSESLLLNGCLCIHSKDFSVVTRSAKATDNLEDFTDNLLLSAVLAKHVSLVLFQLVIE